jgi:hypothetical protein
VDRDEYLIHVCRYVHLNPVAASLVGGPEAWPYSNYLEWIGQRAGTLVDMAFVRRFFETAEACVAFVEAEIPAKLGRRLGPYLLD